ncbi:glycerate kinase type-2 family protein [Roseovarius aquimarinus]|uniref:Glycerate kinase n=1 Tax=Roseovarius aquimarinus TaxID=1229156 RepID=A0ABW7I7M5_9RHOB
MTGKDLKAAVRDLFLAGVRAADPGQAVRRALSAAPLAPAPKGRLLLIAFGKASCAMMAEALRHVPRGQRIEAIAVPNYENAAPIEGCRVMPAGHPLPDENGLEAGVAVMDMLRAAGAEDRVLCLISGGGSALLPTPREGLSLGEKIEVSRLLLAGGFDIGQMNRVRQRLSVLKGGGLVDLAHPAPVRSLIISDVVGDDLSIIASGPTAPPATGADPADLLQSAGLWDALPAVARDLLSAPRRVARRDAENALICSNAQSLAAIADAAPDWAPQVAKEPLVGDVGDAARSLLAQIEAAPKGARQLLIWGGETTVRIAGTGRGGRNQELTVRFARLAAHLPGEWVFLSGGTDGRDGPTDAAGGIVDSRTLGKARAGGVDVDAALADNDSYRILGAAGDLLSIGATGTNVADIQIFLRLDG